MTAFNAFVYENLKYVAEFGRDTALYIYEPTRKLYIVKRVDIRCKAYYEKISYIDNPYLAKILYISESDTAVFVVREYICGDCLADLLKDRGCFSEQTAAKITAQVCKGLANLHKVGLVHRDINPNNILITSDGNAKIIDYGIVRSFEQEKSADTVILGTPGYAAPEQFGFSQSDGRTDIYAVGVLLNVMLTGRLPNECHAGGSLGKIVDKCIQIDFRNRYKSIDELGQALFHKAEREGKADHFIKTIPGLRSQHTHTIILSVLGYLLIGIFIVGIFSSVKSGIPGYICSLISCVFLLVIPFFCFTNFLDIWNRLPFTMGATRRSQKIIYRTLGLFSIFFGLLVIGFSNAV